VTRPRFIIPGQLLFVTARCVGRTFRFTPTKTVRSILWYCLAAMLQQYEGRIQMHEFEFMSNHYHFLLTDVAGCLPQFMCDLDSLLARALNAHRGVSGACIEKGYNAVAVQDDEKVLQHAVYTLANACSAHLVRRTKHWEGPSSLKYRYGQRIEVERPKAGLWAYDDEDDRKKRKRRKREKPMNAERARRRKPSKLPEVARFELVRPPVYQKLDDATLRDEVFTRLDERELALIEERREKDFDVIGMKKILAQNWWDFPRSREDKLGTTPTVSSSTKWPRIEALAARKAFVEAYRAALEAYREAMKAGLVPDVVFPHGTWKMRVLHHVRCHPAPT
jgi:hypothetical protein